MKEDHKMTCAWLYGLNLVRGRDAAGFSKDPEFIHYGGNSGFQAINLAILFGATRILLTGFDMRRVNGHSHFFGEHPKHLTQCTDYGQFIPAFDQAAKLLENVEIINCTPGSALKCFPFGELNNLCEHHTKQNAFLTAPMDQVIL